MALMISTGYSSLMSPDEFRENLNKAVNTTNYPFKDIGSKEPELNESFKYYEVAERFVATQFDRNQELLSLSIAAGKFGVNTDFMWTLYNMASMGALRVEERDDIPYERSYVREEVPHDISPIYSRKNSEEIEHIEEDLIDTRNAYNTVIEEEPGEEEPEPKVEPTEQKPKEFSAELKQSVNEKCKEALEGDKKLSTLLGKMASCQEVELLGTMLDKLNKADFKGNDNKELTIDSFNQMAEPVKAFLLLKNPTLEDVDNKQEDFEIAKKIASKMNSGNLPKNLKFELIYWDRDLVNFIATNEKYKNAIIKYSKNYGKLLDNKSQPLTPQTFDDIVVSALIEEAYNKQTLAKIKTDFSKLIEKIEELKKAIEEKEKNYK